MSHPLAAVPTLEVSCSLFFQSCYNNYNNINALGRGIKGTHRVGRNPGTTWWSPWGVRRMASAHPPCARWRQEWMVLTVPARGLNPPTASNIYFPSILHLQLTLVSQFLSELRHSKCYPDVFGHAEHDAALGWLCLATVQVVQVVLPRVGGGGWGGGWYCWVKSPLRVWYACIMVLPTSGALSRHVHCRLWV